MPTVAAATPPTPPKPTPTIASVTAELDKLADRNEQMAERYNAARIAVIRRDRAAQAAQQHVRQVRVQFNRAQREASQMAAAAYESGTMSATGALLESDSGQSFLDSMSTTTLISDHNTALLTRLKSLTKATSEAEDSASALLTKARADRTAIGKRRDTLHSETAKFKKLLAQLTAAQQRAYASQGAATVGQQQSLHKVRAGSAAAQKAVDFAMAQLGKPYVFAAAGPDAFDCSGLTMAAWATAGVQLPHLASSQYGYGQHVGANELQPGDLVFLYSDIHHVEIYVGNGLAVSAPQEGENVKLVRVADFIADFYGATRLS